MDNNEFERHYTYNHLLYSIYATNEIHNRLQNDM